MWIKTILVILTYGSTIDGYKILMMAPTPTHSHQTPVIALTKALVKKQHTLFVVSPVSIPGLEKNYTHIDVSSAVPLINETIAPDTFTTQKELDQWGFIKALPHYATIGTSHFQAESFINFFNRVKEENMTFDVVIAESMYLPSLCGMSRLLTDNAPIVTITSLPREMMIESDLGSVPHYSYLPFLSSEYSDRMSFLQRIDNWAFYSITVNFWKYLTNSMSYSYFKEVHGPDSTSLTKDCWSNASLALIASNSLYHYPRTLGPNIVEVGPLHLKATPGKLPKLVQDWLDEATTGAIYVNLGPNMKKVNMSESVLSNLLEVFKELPDGYRVLWNGEIDVPVSDQPNNVLAQTWLPQQSVLAHANVKAFMTQGDLLSFQEAVHYGVPTIGMPWTVDQQGIIAKMVHAGVGVRLRLSELESFLKVKLTVEAVLFNERYSENMKKLSEVSHDLSAGALDKAVFWVEHVAKHKGAPHLRPITADTSLFQFLCLDLVLVLFAVVIVTLYVTTTMIGCFLSLFVLSQSKLKKT